MFKLKYKKTINLVSRILFQLHHLSGRNITVAILLPTLDSVPINWKRERAALKQSFTWHYSTQGLPAVSVTTYHRELLPHVFIFSTFYHGSYFLWHSLFPNKLGSRRLTGGLLYTVRTFLPNKLERWFGFIVR